MVKVTDMADNLRAAGCTDEEASSIVSCYMSGNIKKTDKLIAACRKRQLEKMHESQICIDRLDYLSYQMTKE